MLLVKPGHFEQQRKVRPAQSLPPLFRPRFVAVLRQEVPAIQFDRRFVRRQVTDVAGRFCGLVEALNVDPEFSARAQRNQAVTKRQAPRSGIRSVPEDPAGVVQRVAQVVRRRFRGQIWTEYIHDLLAMKAVLWRQCEQLYQGRRLLKPPLALRACLVRLRVKPFWRCVAYAEDLSDSSL